MSSNTPTANITLVIQTFNEISTGSFCTLSGVQVQTSNLPPNASVAANPLPPFTVRVVSPAPNGGTTPIALKFNAVAATPTPNATVVYNIKAVYFNGSGQRTIFTDESSGQNGTVTVYDGPTTGRPTGTWEFAVIVEREVTVGTIVWKSIGIIDPPIDNEPC